jgi:preprotein translocase subunit SecA
MRAGIMELRFQQMAPPKEEKPKLSTNRAEGESSETARAQVNPAKSLKVANRNDRVSVQYKDGSVKRDVKYKHVEEDVINGNAVLVD